MSESMMIEKAPYVFAKDWHRKFPPMIVVSITNVCNLECIHCYHKTFKKLDGYKPRMLDWDVWRKICREVQEWPGVILNFGTDGEPLVHPKFLEMLRFARECKIDPINITTNGLLLDNKMNEALVKENLADIINISMDAFSPESYKKIRGKDEYLTLKENVLKLIQLRNAENSSLKIQVNIINQPEVHHEVDQFKEFWESKVENVMIRTYYDATAVTGGTGGNITGKQEAFEEIDRFPCQQLWRRFNITEEGYARFCVDDWFNKTYIGDLREQGIADIWTSEKYNLLRNLHLTKQFDKISYCQKCTEWQGMKWDYDYFTAMNKMLGRDTL